MNLAPFYSFRSSLIDELEKDLVGPREVDETIDDDPLNQYIIGILYPQTGDPVAPELDEEVSEEDNETPSDPPVGLANVRYPSSMGLTFAVDTESAPKITISAKCAVYKQVPPGSEENSDSKTSRKWKRAPLSPEPAILETRVPQVNYRKEIIPGLELFCRVRKVEVGASAITVVLLNKNHWKPGKLRDEISFFQVQLLISAPEGDAAPFVERPRRRIAGNDQDLRSYLLLYRHALEFATGHGCSVEWDVDPTRASRAREIRTTYVPSHDLLLVDSNPRITSQALTMKFLATGGQQQVTKCLDELCASYESWIGKQDVEAESLEPELASVAGEHLKWCRETLERMRNGVRLLAENGTAWTAFRLANAAMLRQRARTVWLKAGKPSPAPTESEDHRWRPFQLAFFLQCMEGMANPNSRDRELCDLLWFPTGGGKTEAYLGLVAFTVFLRRLKYGDDGAGVTVLMRYTLRLLTIQQFERAALLIACCEDIRRTHGGLGNTPISIGLWVGQGATPNTLAEARTSLNELRQGKPVAELNPVQLHSCVWCGRDLDHRNYYIADTNRRLVIACRQGGCVFEHGLPIHVVDEDIYRFCPTLVIATVDKFASLPWKESTGNLFNLNNPNLRRPEFIIQDELHLISGPLGTLTGLYETAVDLLCTQEGVRPKIIASTATIRRAGEQTRAVFDRKIRQFPPPALDARDTYFAVQMGHEAKAARLYVGLMAPGTSHATLMIRVYASLLQRASDLPADDTVRDPYWTLVGYFNSLRVLGGARMQVQDDVTERIELLAAQADSGPRNIEYRIELTSRESSDQIPVALKNMAKTRPDPEALAVVLATNMISVGVDIDRLGLMVVMGQPQATAEYIQATSRVGRKFPGLVVTLFNANRSRDRSHYESFVAYHSALYRQVESTSATPYSSRARDRGLHAVLVALARLTIPQFKSNSGARAILDWEAALAEIRGAVLQRVREVSPEELEATAGELDQLIRKWRELASERSNLVYNNPRNLNDSLLVEAGNSEPVATTRLRTLWSLRDVDRSSNLYLVS